MTIRIKNGVEIEYLNATAKEAPIVETETGLYIPFHPLPYSKVVVASSRQASHAGAQGADLHLSPDGVGKIL